MGDNPEVIPFPENSGEQPPAGTHRGVLIKAVKNLGVVTSSTFKDKNGNPTKTDDRDRISVHGRRQAAYLEEAVYVDDL